MTDKLESPALVRARAARIVAQVADRGKSLDALLAGGPLDDASAQERGLTRSLVYGTIRWHSRLLAVLTRLSSRPPKELDSELRALTLVGLYQLLHTDIAAHAAVAETVEATRALKQPRAAGLINAILRRCQREGAGIVADDSDDALRYSHPQWLVDRLRHDWSERSTSILAANNEHPPLWLRVNRRHISVDDYAKKLQTAGLPAEKGECAPESLRLLEPVDVRRLPDFDAGAVSVQDAAAQLAAHLLDTQPGHRVLDACAAPGGKTCHILELEPRAQVVAVDASAARLKRVRENLDRLGLEATLLSGDAAEPSAWWDKRPFDRILLDVPCSATGVIRRHPDIKLLRRPTDIAELAGVQRRMLASLWPLVAPGGRLLYASCSALRDETATVIAEFLAGHSDASDVTVQVVQDKLASCGALGNFPGLPAGTAPKTGFGAVPGANPGLAIAAGEARMDGFYYACLNKAAVL